MFIDGARPDVAAAYPTYPANTRAGWGFMVLTNMLPNQGNGTYQFSMYAQDREGHAALLGTRTMTCANASATKPFGAIDTPTQGGVASGSSYRELRVGADAAAEDDSDSTGRRSPCWSMACRSAPVDYNHARPDIEALFPGFQNTRDERGDRVPGARHDDADAMGCTRSRGW